jgi:hypothetical protein
VKFHKTVVTTANITKERLYQEMQQPNGAITAFSKRAL